MGIGVELPAWNSATRRPGRSRSGRASACSIARACELRPGASRADTNFFNGLVLRGETPSADRDSDLMDLLSAAITVAEADMGNIQFRDELGALRIVAQIGFERPFLDFFESGRSGEAACGAALKSGRRVVVDDVEGSKIFSPEARAVLLEAGVLSVQSTPSDRQMVGILSTHYRVRTGLSQRDFAGIDCIIRLIGIHLPPAHR
jgi:hypothetical protein